MGGEGGRDIARGVDAQIFAAPRGQRHARPVELRADPMRALAAAGVGFHDLRPRGRGLGDGTPLFEERRPQRDVLGPGDRPVVDRQVLDSLANFDVPAAGAQAQRAFKEKLGMHQGGALPQRIAVRTQGVRNDSGLAVHAQTHGSLLIARPAEQVQAEVMPQNAGQQLAFGVAAVLMHVGRPGRRFNRAPGRRPERVDAAGFVDNRRDVAALFGHHHLQMFVFDAGGAAPAIQNAGHATVVTDRWPMQEAAVPWRAGRSAARAFRPCGSCRRGW